MAPGRNSSRRGQWSWLLCGVVLLAVLGCDATTRYKVLSTVFDGVPRLPPPEEYCQGIDTGQSPDETALAEPDGESADRKAGSSHEPYREKRCNDCHAFDRPGGLLRPKRELCFTCHRDFIQGPVVHGPVAVGDCLACHLPHSSPNAALLIRDKAELCGTCHQERRLAAKMHDRLRQQQMACTDCHNPHFGHAVYFLD